MTVSPDLDRRFRDAAVTLGLVDIGFDVVDSPMGRSSSPPPTAASRRSRSIPSPTRSSSGSPASPGRAFSARPAAWTRHAASSTSTSRASGARSTSSLDLRALPPFTVSVLQELARVPYGETTTYGALAARVGRPRAARAVGTVMNRNRIPIVLPCHRVVGSSGNLVGYAGGLDRKIALLELEGALL